MPAPLMSTLTVDSSFVDIWLHLLVAVFRSDVTLSSQEELDLLIGSTQNRG